MANYNVEKLTKLGALKALAERVKGNLDTLDGRVEALEETVEGLTTTGGEKNVIVSVKVNGTAQTVAGDRSVDISVPTKTSQLENDQGYQDENGVKALVSGGIAEWAEKTTNNQTIDTFKELVEWAAAHSSNAQEIVADVAKNKSSIEALKGLVGETAVSQQIGTALGEYVKKDGAKQLSTEDYTTEEKAKLAGIEIAAENEVAAMLDEVFPGE